MNAQNSIIPFTFESSNTIRTEMVDGQAWFLAKDICDALNYSNARKAVKDHVYEDDVTKRYIIDSLGRNQLASWLNISGVYALIFGSKLPSAQKFKHWVTSEVLPALQNYGHYEVKEVKPVKTDEFSDKDMFLIKDALYKLSSKFTFDQAMRNACWFSLRALTGVKSPAKLRYSDLDVIVEELKRISYITCCYMDAKRNAEQEICRKILRVQGSSKELAEILGNMITDAASDEAIAKLSKSDRSYLNAEIETVRQQIESNKAMRMVLTC